MVSIIIPVYNRFDLVKEMIDTIVAQTYNDWELILVDDGSTDGTDIKLEAHCSKDSRIIFCKRDRLPKGAPTCRNIGFDNAKGEYIVFFDSDDIVAPSCIEQRVLFMHEHPNVDAGVFPARHFKKDIAETTGLLNGIPIFEDDLEEFLSANLPYIVWNVIFKRSSLISHKIKWDEKLLSLQDADFNIQCFLQGLKVEYADNSMIDYFARAENNNSISAGIYKESRFNSHLYFVKKMFQGLSKDLLVKYKKAMFNRLIYTYILMSYNYSANHISQLLCIAESYNCRSRILRILIAANRILVNNLKVKTNIANAITFPFFIHRMRSCQRKRKKYNIIKFTK